MDKKIKSVWLIISEGLEIYYEVGKNDVTEIREALKNGEMANILYYQVFKNDKLFCDMHNFTEVQYQE